jgi:hypothetical protein
MLPSALIYVAQQLPSASLSSLPFFTVACLSANEPKANDRNIAESRLGNS